MWYCSLTSNIWVLFKILLKFYLKFYFLALEAVIYSYESQESGAERMAKTCNKGLEARSQA